MASAGLLDEQQIEHTRRKIGRRHSREETTGCSAVQQLVVEREAMSYIDRLIKWAAEDGDHRRK